ncbi:MAG: TetR/AcrR family transcriptional regulator [Oceanococcus sp.]
MTDSQSSAPTSQRPSGQYAGKAAVTRQRERKAKLMAAGIELIGTEGFSATSINAVCAHAGLTKRYFYEAFSSSEEMLIQAYRTVAADMLKSISSQTAPHLNDSRKLVRVGIRATFDYVAAEPIKARLMFVEAQSVRGQLGKVYVESMNGFVALLLSLTKPFLAADAATDAELRVMARGIIGALMHLCQGWIASSFLQPVDELVDGTERIFVGIGRELGIAGWKDDTK